MSDRLYKQVAANSVETSVFDVPSGKTLNINELGGDAGLDAEVKVEIKFGDDILFVTHSSTVQVGQDIQVVGDGTKQVVIRLVNDTTSSESIGGYWNGYLNE